MNSTGRFDPIDVVMPWVDGNDPEHRASLARHWPKQPWLRPAPYRFRENGELRYALRSIHFHLPWVRTIHLVTNGQADGNPRLHVMSSRLPRFRLRADRYRHTLAFNNLLLCLAFRRRRWSYPPHLPLLLELDKLAWLNTRFGFWLRRTARHRFRHRTDALARVLYINAIPWCDRARIDGARQVKLASEHVVAIRDNDAFSQSLEGLVEAPPAFFCLNDEIDDDIRAAVRAAEMQAALAAIFPNPAPFEKGHRSVAHTAVFEPIERPGT